MIDALKKLFEWLFPQKLEPVTELFASFRYLMETYEPDLDKSVEDMRMYDAHKKICRSLHIAVPTKYENVSDCEARIIDALLLKHNLDGDKT